MDKFDEFESKLQNKGYINDPYSFIFDYYDEYMNENESPNSYEIIEFIRIIHFHNQAYTKKIKENTNEINAKISSAQKLHKEPIIDTFKKEDTVDNTYTYPQDTQTNQVIKSLTYYKTTEEFKNNIKGINDQGIYKIKLYLLKQIMLVTKKIRAKVLSMPLANLTDLQIELLKYQEFLEELKPKIEIKEQEEAKSKSNTYNIIIVPNSKSSSYLLEDITAYSDSYDEITHTIDNIMTNQIFSSKSIKQIRDKNEKLYEYKRKNGIRVLFIRNGNNIFITSLFYKDKQRSIKIDQAYEESIKRYNNFIATGVDYTTIDFEISQKELIGEIYSEIETGISYRKKVDSDV